MLIHVVEIFRLGTLNTPVAGMTIGAFTMKLAHSLRRGQPRVASKTNRGNWSEKNWDLAHLCGFVSSSAPKRDVIPYFPCRKVSCFRLGWLIRHALVLTYFQYGIPLDPANMVFLGV